MVCYQLYRHEQNLGLSALAGNEGYQGVSSSYLQQLAKVALINIDPF